MMGVRVCIGMLAACVVVVTADAGEKSESKVKATATATKIADGKQTVTITLEIEEGWYIYANPINANTEVLKPNQTVVSFKTMPKTKVPAVVTYPKGKKKMDGKYEFDIYQGKIVIEAQVQRPPGDSGAALRISIDVNVCRKNECLLPGTLMLTVP